MSMLFAISLVCRTAGNRDTQTSFRGSGKYRTCSRRPASRAPNLPAVSDLDHDVEDPDSVPYTYVYS